MTKTDNLPHITMKSTNYAGIAAILALLLSFCSAATEPLAGWKEKIAQAGFSGTVYIADANKVIFHHSFGWSDREKKLPFADDTVFDIGSLTKQFVASAVLQLAEQGKLTLTTSIDNYLPNVPADKKSITLHHLLIHAAGLPTNLPNHGLYDKVTSDRFLSLAMSQKLIAEPGAQYQYSNIGYGLLAQVIEIVSGQNWETYIRQNLLLPAGLTETGYRQLNMPLNRLAKNYGADPNWLQRTLGLQAHSRSVGDSLQHLRQEPGQRWFEGAGGFLSTVSDMHAWYLTIQSGRILNKESWQKMQAQHIVLDAEKNSYYGYGWVIDSQNDVKRMNHTGSNGYSYATFDYYPEVGLFILSASNDIDNYPHALIGDLKKSVLRAAIDKSAAK